MNLDVTSRVSLTLSTRSRLALHGPSWRNDDWGISLAVISTSVTEHPFSSSNSIKKPTDFLSGKFLPYQGVLNLACEQNHSNWQIEACSQNYVLTLKSELEKLQIIVVQKDAEIAYLKEIIDLLKIQKTQ